MKDSFTAADAIAYAMRIYQGKQSLAEFSDEVRHYYDVSTAHEATGYTSGIRENAKRRYRYTPNCNERLVMADALIDMWADADGLP